MTTSTESNAKPLLIGLLALFAIIAVVLVMKVFAMAWTALLIAGGVLAVYEGYRFLALLRGRTPPPSSLGVVRGAGRVVMTAFRTLPTVVRWARVAANLGVHAVHEIVTGAVFGAVVGVAAGWHFGFLFIGTFVGLIGGIVVGGLVGRRRLRREGAKPQAANTV
jgi:hypothetical protein